MKRGSLQERVLPSISIVGAGSLGSALAVALRGAGYCIGEIVHRGTVASGRRATVLARRVGAKSAAIANAKLDADLVWLCVPDHSIAMAARELAGKRKSWRGAVVLHSSGALASDELSAFRERGARVASLHPLMTFVPNIDQAFVGVPFAVEGDAVAVRLAREIARALGGEAFAISKSKKAAYHAWCSFTSPMLLALLVSSEQVAKLAGISAKPARRRMLPIVLQTIENYFKRGPAKAFSGPILRGDVATIERHLEALKSAPLARAVYVALARAALDDLPVTRREAQLALLRKK